MLIEPFQLCAPPAEDAQLAEAQWKHRVELPKVVDSEPVVFRWHFPRGTFARRMSALELAAFLLPHMPSILPLLAGNPLIHAHFRELLGRFTTVPTIACLDEVYPWIKAVIRAEEDDIVELNAFPTADAAAGPKYFVLSE